MYHFRLTLLLATNYVGDDPLPYRPEVGGEGFQVREGHEAVAGQAPAGAPGVADEEPLFAPIVAHRHDRVAAQDGLVFSRHGPDARARDLLRIKAFVDREAEDKRETVRQARQHLRKGVDAVIGRDAAFFCLLVTARGRLFRETPDVIRPCGLPAGPVVLQRLDAVAQRGAGVIVDRALNQPLIVIDEEPADVCIDIVRPVVQELQVARQRLGGAASQSALVLNR